MRWTQWFVGYLATTAALLVIDAIWLRVIAVDWYKQGIGHLMTPDVNLVAAALFYLLFPVGLMVFAVVPQVAGPWWRASVFAALFGFCAYATYDLTNLATLRAWPLSLSLIDMAWGAFASACAATAGWAALSSWK